MKLILGQGNPTATYDRTRHNAGFHVLDEFARRHDLTWSEKSKFKAMLAETIIDGEKVILIKPTTYYNETGISARKVVDFYSLDPAKDLIVIHDDLALPFGTIRTRKQGSDAGNNGIKSLNAHLGSNYHRIRIGVWSELRDRMDDAEFVLSRFTTEEHIGLKDMTHKIIGKIDDFIADSLDITTSTKVA